MPNDVPTANLKLSPKQQVTLRPNAYSEEILRFELTWLKSGPSDTD